MRSENTLFSENGLDLQAEISNIILPEIILQYSPYTQGFLPQDPYIILPILLPQYGHDYLAAPVDPDCLHTYRNECFSQARINNIDSGAAVSELLHPIPPHF